MPETLTPQKSRTASQRPHSPHKFRTRPRPRIPRMRRTRALHAATYQLLEDHVGQNGCSVVNTCVYNPRLSTHVFTTHVTRRVRALCSRPEGHYAALRRRCSQRREGWRDARAAGQMPCRSTPAGRSFRGCAGDAAGTAPSSRPGARAGSGRRGNECETGVRGAARVH